MVKNWFIHMGGETFGPLSTDVVCIMLKQNRLHFTDFVWGQELTKWVRLADVDEFAGLLPTYPKCPIPTVDKDDPRPHVRTGQVPKAVKETKEPKEHKEPKRELKVVEEPPKETKSPKELEKARLDKLAAHPRFTVDGTVHLDSGQKLKIVDLSAGGVFLATKKPLEVGSEVTFTLAATGLDGQLKMEGVVIRHGTRHDEAGFAIEFMRVNPAYKRLLQDFLSDFAKAG